MSHITPNISIKSSSESITIELQSFASFLKWTTTLYICYNTPVLYIQKDRSTAMTAAMGLKTQLNSQKSIQYKATQIPNLALKGSNALFGGNNGSFQSQPFLFYGNLYLLYFAKKKVSLFFVTQQTNPFMNIHHRTLNIG